MCPLERDDQDKRLSHGLTDLQISICTFSPTQQSANKKNTHKVSFNDGSTVDRTNCLNYDAAVSRRDFVRPDYRSAFFPLQIRQCEFMWGQITRRVPPMQMTQRFIQPAIRSPSQNKTGFQWEQVIGLLNEKTACSTQTAEYTAYKSFCGQYYDRVQSCMCVVW